MPLTLADILTVKTPDEIKALIFAELTANGFPVTDWEVGSVGRSLVEALSEIFSDFSALQVEIAKGGLLEEATGDFLTLLARSNFNIERKEASFAEASVTLSDTGAGGPYTIVPGQLWASTADGLLWNNTTGGTLVLSGTLALTFKAESPGTDYNVATNAINILKTPLPGVILSASVVNVTAVDEESDEDLRERAQLQWATLAQGATADSYKAFALNAAPAVRRVKVQENVPTPGSVKVTIARQDGTATGGDVTLVQTELDVKRPLTVTVLVVAATEVTQNIVATVRVKTDQQAAAVAYYATAIQDFFRTVEIDDTLFRAGLIEVLMTPAGVSNATISTPASDLVLSGGQVAKLGTVSISYVLV